MWLSFSVWWPSKLCCVSYTAPILHCGTHGSTKSNDHSYLQVVVPTIHQTIHNMCKKQQLQSKVSKFYQLTWLQNTNTKYGSLLSFPSISNTNKSVSFNHPKPSRTQDPSLYWKSGSESISLCLSNFDSYLRWLAGDFRVLLGRETDVGSFQENISTDQHIYSSNVTLWRSTLPCCWSCCQRNKILQPFQAEFVLSLQGLTRRAAASCSHGCFVAPLFW